MRKLHACHQGKKSTATKKATEETKTCESLDATFGIWQPLKHHRRPGTLQPSARPISKKTKQNVRCACDGRCIIALMHAYQQLCVGIIILKKCTCTAYVIFHSFTMITFQTENFGLKAAAGEWLRSCAQRDRTK